MLLSHNFKIEIFSEVEPDPSLKTFENLYSKFEKSEVSLFIGVGGGSVMDVTKLVAQALSQKRSPCKYACGDIIPNEKGVPVMLVPTTSGTGSEVSDIVVLKLDNGNKKFLKNSYYFPDIVIIDPLLTISMPQNVTAICGVDALSHAIEGIMHKNSNPFTYTFGFSSIEIISKYLRKAIADGENLEARYYMSIAAMFGMMAMCASGTALYAHSASFVITKYKHTPHGVGCALGLPYIMDFNMPVITNKLAKIANAMGEQTLMLSEWGKAKTAVCSVINFIRDCGLPVCLKEYGGINKSDLEEMADMMITMYPRPMNPRIMTREDSVKYWHNMWDGKI
ncbi:Long-chain-alcohol dehydrogenase 1 [subsurface metagenome]